MKSEASGNLEQALVLYVRGQSWGNAARLASSLDRNFEAGSYCLRAGRPYDAAVCFQKAGALNECLDALTRIPPTSPRFRSACLEAVRVCHLLCSSLETLAPFLMPFITSSPVSKAEAVALNQIAVAFAQTGKTTLAGSIYRRLLSAFPDDEAARDGIASLPEPGAGVEREGTVELPAKSPPTPVGARVPPLRGRLWGAVPSSDRRVRIRERRLGLAALEVPRPVPPRVRTDTLELQVLPAVGTTFAGRFRIEALIGEGGSASVFRALDLELDEPIALKLFRHTTPADTENLIARFKLELSLSRHLAHPNIIRVFDLGIHQGWRYLTMELLEGSDLARRLAALGKPMPVLEGLRTLEQICVGLQAAHDLGVVHRDIKPHNLFLTEAGVAKVMDFGIAKKLRAPGSTVAGTIIGTPEYMSPEQTTGSATVTPAADLYSLGATAYMMFTGAPPFKHPELLTLLMAHANQLPQSPRLKNPEIDLELDRTILRLLEKEPERRFTSARELGQTLKGIRERLAAG